MARAQRRNAIEDRIGSRAIETGSRGGHRIQHCGVLVRIDEPVRNRDDVHITNHGPTRYRSQ